MLKILQARLQKYVNHELSEVQAGFRKGTGSANIKLPTSTGSCKKAREFQKNIYFCFINYAKAFDCVDHNKMENSERDGNTRPLDLHTDLSRGRSSGLVLRNLYAGQKATVRTGHGTTDWFQIGKGVHQGSILPPLLI